MVISAILPNFNHSRELETSLGAIVAQTRPFDEIIVIDDASTDDSAEVIERFARQCPQIRLLRNQDRLGVARTVNRGIEAARGSHVILTSADEKILPDMCSLLANTVERWPDSALAVSRYAVRDNVTGILTEHGGDSALGTWYIPDGQPVHISAERFRALLGQRFVWLGANTAMVRRDALLEVGGFDPELQWHCDWFALYAIAARYGFCVVPQTLAVFTYSPNSYSARGMKDRQQQAKVVTSIVHKLDDPRFAALRELVLAAPAVVSPFATDMIRALAGDRGNRRLWYRLVLWWWSETLRGRRRGMIRRWMKRMRAE
jgi:glycosyltransferase involved in cell wall biosynthesis